MGAVTSYLRSIYFGAKTFVQTLSELNGDFDALLKRINADPGLPVPNPTTAYWQQDPPWPELVYIRSPELPSTADVVIVGSGITGASLARGILRHGGKGTKVVMLEARTVCSGATGRNGGHIKAEPYHEIQALKKKFGAARAAEIIRFRLRHVEVLTELAKAEGLGEAEARTVETVDLFFHDDTFAEARREVRALSRDMPDVAKDVQLWDGPQARERFSAGEHVVGAVSYKAGAMWPYRLVTAILKSLLDHHPSDFSIETSTPVLSIQASAASASHPFTVNTPRGPIQATQVIHATNAHAPRLIPGIRGKLFAVRGQMSAQRPGHSFPSLDGSRSWSLRYQQGFDYITQRPGDAGLVMTGGGWAQSGNRGMDEIGVWSDDKTNYLTGAHLSGILPMAFGPEHWGADGPGGRVESMWTGSIAATVDMLPFVGRLDPSLTGRKVPLRTSNSGVPSPAEWICAGYSGEGMVNAWLCGQACAMMVLGKAHVIANEEPGKPGGNVWDWFPKEMLISPKRVRDGNINELATWL